MFLAKVSIKRPIMTTMGIMLFIIFGALAFVGLNLNLMPDVEIPFVTVQTIYPGAGPKEIETLISKRVEDAVSTVSQIERVESYSLDGVSIVIIEFKISKDVNIANQEVKDKVDTILNDLPDDAMKPIIQKVDFRAFPIVNLVLSGDQSPKELFEIADKTLKDRFAQIEGVANVEINGGQEREIRVVMDNKVVYENLISFPQMMQILAVNNMDIPGGYFNIDDQEYTVRLSGEFENVEEMKNLQIPTAFGPKKLGQIADVRDSGKDIRQRAIFYDAKKALRNENVVRLGIVKSPEGNVVRVAKAIKEAIPEIKEILPDGATLEIIDDDSVFIQSTVDDTMSNILLGIVFTSIILLIFLANVRSTIIVALSMPTSIISTFLLLQMSGLTLNMMTLMGLSVSVGVLVANSVVVIENIFRHKNLGLNNQDASLIGTSEVTVAVLASTLTNLVVFLPIASMSSLVGQFLRELALAASFATVFSLIFSFTLTPMLSSLMLPKENKPGKLARKLDAIFKSWDAAYKRHLTTVLKGKMRSFIIVAGSFILFVLSAIIYGPRIGFEFMPNFDDGKLKVEVELPVGYNLSETATVLHQIEDRIKTHPEVDNLITNLGMISNLSTGTNMARMDISLVDAKERDASMEDMIGIFVSELAGIPNAKIVVDFAGGMGGGYPIELFLMGQELEKLEELKDDVMATIQDVPGLINLDQSSRAGKPEITVFPVREKLIEAGLTTQELAITLRAAIEGMESTKYREFGNEYDITVTLTDESVDTPEDIGNIGIISRSGIMYRMAQLADIRFTKGYSKILHRDKYIAIQITGSPAPGVPLGNVTNEITRRLDNFDFPSGYMVRWGGNVKMMNEMAVDMMFAFVMAILLTYMLLAAILESFVQPIYILLTLPLAMIGVFAALYHTNVAFGLTSLMAIVMLIGIVVNNAILILDYANQLQREKGMSVKDSLIEAAPTKFKPILMASLAIILGMLPMALGIGDAGKEMRIPLGVVAIGGLVVSTVLTLFVIPAFNYLMSREKKEVV